VIRFAAHVRALSTKRLMIGTSKIQIKKQHHQSMDGNAPKSSKKLQKCSWLPILRHKVVAREITNLENLRFSCIKLFDFPLLSIVFVEASKTIKINDFDWVWSLKTRRFQSRQTHKNRTIFHLPGARKFLMQTGVQLSPVLQTT
jgi:hypothetical protein